MLFSTLNAAAGGGSRHARELLFRSDDSRGDQGLVV